MDDVVYWVARCALVAGWLAVAGLAWRRRDPALWRLGAGVALLFASVRALRWNYALLESGRALLRAFGEYEQRIWFKLALAVLLVAALALAAIGLRRLPAAVGLRLLVVGIGLQGVLLAIETLSLDEAMPRWLVTQPGRYLVEGCCVALALGGALRRGGTP